MRNPDRIDRIAKLFYDLWKKNPDWRFCQLVANVTKMEDSFYLEDEDFELKLHKRHINSATKEEPINRKKYNNICAGNFHNKIYSKEGCTCCWYCSECGMHGCDNMIGKI